MFEREFGCKHVNNLCRQQKRLNLFKVKAEVLTGISVNQIICWPKWKTGHTGFKNTDALGWLGNTSISLVHYWRGEHCTAKTCCPIWCFDKDGEKRCLNGTQSGVLG